MKSHQSESFLRAQRRVDQIKWFYKHLGIYIVANILLLMFKFRAIDFFTDKGIVDEGFLDWFEWNIIGTPILWGIGLLLHALHVFKLKSKPLKELTPGFYKEWEERQIKKYLEEDNQ